MRGQIYVSRTPPYPKALYLPEDQLFVFSENRRFWHLHEWDQFSHPKAHVGTWMQKHFNVLDKEVEVPTAFRDILMACQLRHEERSSLRKLRRGVHGRELREIQFQEDLEHLVVERYYTVVIEDILSRGSLH